MIGYSSCASMLRVIKCFIYSITAALPHPDYTLKKPSSLRTKYKPRAPSNPNPVNSSPAYYPLRHIAVADFLSNLSTWAILISVEPCSPCALLANSLANQISLEQSKSKVDNFQCSHSEICALLLVTRCDVGLIISRI